MPALDYDGVRSQCGRQPQPMRQAAISYNNTFIRHLI